MLQFFHDPADAGYVVALHDLAQLPDLALDGLAVSVRDLVAELSQGFLHLVSQAIGLVAGIGQLASPSVLSLVLAGLPHHVLHIVLGKIGGCSYSDPLLSPRGLVLGRDVQDAVGVNVECHLDLRHASRRRGDTLQPESAQGHVVGGHRPLALQHMDVHRCLAVCGRGEDLTLSHGDGGVALDEGRSHAAQGLQAQRQRRHVQQQHVLDLAAQHARLQASSHRYHLVGVDSLVGLLAAAEPSHQVLDHGHTGSAAHQHDLFDIASVEASVGHSLLEGDATALHQVLSQLLQLGPGQLHLEVLGARSIGGDEGQVDLGLHHRGKLNLGLLRCFLKPLQSLAIPAQVYALILLELVGDVVCYSLIPVIAAQESVAAGGLDLHHALAHLQDGDIESAAAQVEDQDGLQLLLVQPVGQGRGCRLVDDAQYIESSDPASVLGGLALGVVEVGRHRDHRLPHLLAQVGLSVPLQLLQDHGRDLLGSIGLARDRNVDASIARWPFHDLVGQYLLSFFHLWVIVSPPHQALDGEDGVVGVDSGLALGHLAHQSLARLGESHHRGAEPSPLSGGDNRRIAAFQHGDDGVRRS